MGTNDVGITEKGIKMAETIKPSCRSISVEMLYIRLLQKIFSEGVMIGAVKVIWRMEKENRVCHDGPAEADLHGSCGYELWTCHFWTSGRRAGSSLKMYTCPHLYAGAKSA